MKVKFEVGEVNSLPMTSVEPLLPAEDPAPKQIASDPNTIQVREVMLASAQVIATCVKVQALITM